MKTSNRSIQRGFTLVELMVGLALGLIASLAIFSTVSSFEEQRRTTGSGVDMQQNGLLALYSIEQDIRMAGFGLIDTSSTPGNLPCARINAYNPGSVFNGAPVIIVNGSTGNDIIAINRLNSDTGGIVTGGHAASITTPLSGGSVPSSIALDTNVAINPNDFILVSQPATDCALLKVNSVSSSLTGGITVSSAGNAGADATQSPASFPNYGAAASAVVINLGPARTVSATTFGSTDATLTPTFATTKYKIQINSSSNSYDLARTTDNWQHSSVVASNIVNVAAQYGIADAPPGGGALAPENVTHWIDASGSAYGGTDWSTMASVADVKRVKAIRVAIVARSAQKTSCDTTTSAPGWFGGTIDLSGMADWQCYRYKIYQTIIPIRNVIWGNFQ